MTEELGIEHTFSFDTAWSFAEYVETQGKLSKPIHFKPSKFSKKGFQEGILEVEKHLKKNKRTFSDKEKDFFNPIKHKFCNGLYIREIFNPAGQLLVTKIHKKEHPFFLMKGKMSILTEDGVKHIQAPHHGITKPGTKRIIYTHTDCVFVTVHATDKTDVDEIEKEVIANDFNDPAISLEEFKQLTKKEQL